MDRAHAWTTFAQGTGLVINSEMRIFEEDGVRWANGDTRTAEEAQIMIDHNAAL